MGRRRENRDGRRGSRAAASLQPEDTPEHGNHTLRVWHGTVVGHHGRDVFVELGVRMQGVIPATEFEELPELGSRHAFTLGGQEEGLWALSRAEALPLVSWERAEVGDAVEARVLSANRGGFETRVGRMHGFLPFSESGLRRREDPSTWCGQSLPCEVVDVDPERQRVILSHRRFVRRSERTRAEREAARLRAGSIVSGRVAELVPFGAFIDLGRGSKGLLHRSNIAYERVVDPAQYLELGQSLELVVLGARADGKRISLGLKQRYPSPWRGLARRAPCGSLVRGEVIEVAPFGAFVRVRAGVIGLVHKSELGLGPGQPVGQRLRVGDEVVVRVLEIDVERERLSLSLTRTDGSLLDPDECVDAADLEQLEVRSEDRVGGLGRLLDQALRERTRDRSTPDSEEPRRA
ncbi:MAG: S1 RNA-binding domain-containing protein [Planctomycetota bacterium]